MHVVKTACVYVRAHSHYERKGEMKLQRPSMYRNSGRTHMTEGSQLAHADRVVTQGVRHTRASGQGGPGAGIQPKLHSTSHEPWHKAGVRGAFF